MPDLGSVDEEEYLEYSRYSVHSRTFSQHPMVRSSSCEQTAAEVVKDHPCHSSRDCSGSPSPQVLTVRDCWKRWNSCSGEQLFPARFPHNCGHQASESEGIHQNEQSGQETALRPTRRNRDMMPLWMRILSGLSGITEYWRNNRQYPSLLIRTTVFAQMWLPITLEPTDSAGCAQFLPFSGNRRVTRFCRVSSLHTAGESTSSRTVENRRNVALPVQHSCFIPATIRTSGCKVLRIPSTRTGRSGTVLSVPVSNVSTMPLRGPLPQEPQGTDGIVATNCNYSQQFR